MSSYHSSLIKGIGMGQVMKVQLSCYLALLVKSRRCGYLVTWFCYQLIAKPGNKTATPPQPDPYNKVPKWNWARYLSLVPSSQQDKDCAGSQARAQLALVLTEAVFAARQLAGTLRCGVVTWLKNNRYNLYKFSWFTQFTLWTCPHSSYLQN